VIQKDAHQLIEEIGAIVKTVWNNSENPDGLSKALNDIAVLHWALALWRAELDEQERHMKAELDLDKANIIQKRTDLGDAVNKAEIRATIELGPKRAEYTKVASAVDKTKIMLQANERVMDSVRSRLSLIKSEMKGGV
jgi:hypothetical protein